tara:strand:- start:1281 stop:3578 length:2298 start_codon:yes stop_codon:yes gene_type:complete
MAKRKDKNALRVKRMYELCNSTSRSQWEYINQKGFDFANDNQMTAEERALLEEQGMPTFTINRIMPIVEMLNFYATANRPRWQAIGVDGSDSDVAAVFSDIADYVWDLSDGTSLYANCINDSITKSVGYLLVTVDQDSDNGMGDVKIIQPEPFDVFVDPKSRDLLFKDAAFIMIRKVLPRQHLETLHPQFKNKIKKASSDIVGFENNLSEKSWGKHQKDFAYKDIGMAESITEDGENDQLIEFYEVYEKIKVEYTNVFYKIPPSKEQMENIQKQIAIQLQEMQKEMQVRMLEEQQRLQMSVQKGEMLPQRFELEMEKLSKNMNQQLKAEEQKMMSEMQQMAEVVENRVISKKEFQLLMQDEKFQNTVVEAIPFYQSRVKLTCVVGDATLYEKVLPETITEYPIVPFHYKWTGTPYPISAISPLIGKQQEINKSHQILVHNASLGSSLRWMFEEGSVDTEIWEKYSSSPGALLPIRPGAAPPTPVQPAPLNSAFFNIAQNAKMDMEYLAGIYSSMQGDTGQQHETFRGMLAIDEYGTRRIKQWMNHFLDPALKQLGEIVMHFTQAVYTAHKKFRIVQPSALQEGKEVEMNVPMYNDMGEAIGKSMDYSAAKFDVRVISGSTLPVNRWAYLSELKELLQMGVVDDIAVLAETDIKNKNQIAQRKSMLSQLQGQMQGMQEALKDKDGTIETLERQLVQAGIKGKVMQAEMEITKKKEEVKGTIDKAGKDVEDGAKQAVKDFANKAVIEGRILQEQAQNVKKDLENDKE